MKKSAFFFVLLVSLLSFKAYALNYEDYPTVKLRSLDKITARTMTFEATVGSTVRFGEIFIKVQSCRKPPPVQKSEAAAFLQVWQTNMSADKAGTNDETQKQSRWIFSGWMFASSPGLSGMDHPVYDVWVIDCLGKDPEPAPPPEEQVPDPQSTGDEAATVTDDPGTATTGQPAETQTPVTETGEVTPADDPGAFEESEPVPQDQPVQSDDGAVDADTDPANAEFNSVIEGTTLPTETIPTETPAMETSPTETPAPESEAPPESNSGNFEGIY